MRCGGEGAIWQNCGGAGAMNTWSVPHFHLDGLCFINDDDPLFMAQIYYLALIFEHTYIQNRMISAMLDKAVIVQWLWNIVWFGM